jgi:hypothetical protein
MHDLSKDYEFFGKVQLPKGMRVSNETKATLAYIAWKNGINEDEFKSGFRKWFRKQAEKYPTYFKVRVFNIYPVDEFQFIGPHQS